MCLSKSILTVRRWWPDSPRRLACFGILDNRQGTAFACRWLAGTCFLAHRRNFQHIDIDWRLTPAAFPLRCLHL